MRGFDVGVIGLGVHGASAAFHLAQRGVNAIAFERGAPAGGPTGRSSAVVRCWYTNEFLAQAAVDSLQVFKNFNEVTAGREAAFKQSGVMFMHPAADRELLLETATRLNSIGAVVDVLQPDQVADVFPSFNRDGIAVGAWEELGGWADPAGTTRGLLERAVELGVEARTCVDVVEIAPLPVGGAVIVTSDGVRTTCSSVLIAAGPWTKSLARLVGVELPLTVERHIIGTFGWGTAERVPFVYADMPFGYYAKPEGEEQYCVGALEEGARVDPDDYSEELEDEEAVKLASAVVDRLPHLAESEHRGGWASLYDVSPDWQPVIGEIADGIFVDAGTSGHGFKLAPALGSHIADLVLGQDVSPGLEQFHPNRFIEGRDISSGFGRAKILG